MTAARHHASTITTPTNEAALTANAQPGPADASEHAAEGGADGSSHVERHARQRHRLPECVGGTTRWMACHAGTIRGAPTPSANVSSEEDGRRHVVGQREHGQRPGSTRTSTLGWPRATSAAIGQRSGRQPQQEQWQQAGGLDQRQQCRGRREVAHQPRRGVRREERADVRTELGGEEGGEHPVVQRAHREAVASRRRSGAAGSSAATLRRASLHAPAVQHTPSCRYAGVRYLRVVSLIACVALVAIALAGLIARRTQVGDGRRPPPGASAELVAARLDETIARGHRGRRWPALTPTSASSPRRWPIPCAA